MGKRKLKSYMPGEALTKNKLIELFIFIGVGALCYFPGREVGIHYTDFALESLPSFMHGVLVNLLMWGFTCLVFIYIENRYLWERVWRSNEINPFLARYDKAPISIGLTVGILSAWIY